MAIPWGTLNAQERRLLKDTNSAKYKWSEAELLDFIAWSLDALCSHTAVATATGFDLTSITNEFVLPDNIYESILRSGAVYVDNGITKSYLNPIRFNRLAGNPFGYYLSENDSKIIVNSTLTSGTLNIQYFAYYSHPINDDSLINAPSWAYAALCYRMAAYAMAPFAARSANIRQWGQQPDTGRPTDNPLSDQFFSFIDMWERELTLYPVQQRENYFTR